MNLLEISPLKWHLIIYVEYPQHKTCKNTEFHWPKFSRIRTKSSILSLYQKIRVSENPYSRIFYAVITHEWMALRYISNWISRIGEVHNAGNLNPGFSENATVGSFLKCIFNLVSLPKSSRSFFMWINFLWLWNKT